MSMFCYQCQETLKNQGCVKIGVCGKTSDVANLQDLLLYLLKGISFFGVRARELGVTDEEVDRFVMEGLFSTVTNVNFDPERFVAKVKKGLELRDSLRDRFLEAYRAKHGKAFDGPLPGMATWSPDGGGLDTFIQKGATIGVQSEAHLNEDVRSLRQLLIYGLKGMAAYADHAYILGYKDREIMDFMQEGLAATTDDSLTVGDLFGLVVKCGQVGVATMALLDKANTETYGHPEPTEVNIDVGNRPGILVSGHDLLDLDELLQQTVGSGVDVYTHGEMLPANAYPAFKKYDHFVGNYGNSWWSQQEEFVKFNGAILMTTNCIQKPRDSYADRIFTTGQVGWPGLEHIPDREPGKQKDFGPVIRRALQCAAPTPLESGTIPIGFAHQAVLSVADKVVDAVKSGAIKRFVVMAGCDGRLKSREYFTDLARGLPEDTVILTAGCAKYRYNKLGLGNIGGIPRVIDAGQCNDSYSLVVIAQKLAEAFGLGDVNDLPLSFDIGWYEQKAVLVLLALLSLGVKHIRLGPTLPAFVSPNVLDVLVEKFDVKPTGTVESDLQAIMAGA
jgi:hydroxylamine reductase